MANTKISALTANTNPNGGEELVYAYNNANGKMTLNTMKTFANTGQQEELVSGTNIKTINGESILGSGNLVVQGGGGGGGDSSFDAVVDAGGGGDYTSVSAAIAAGNYNIFVKNGSYTETAGWDPYSNNASFLHIVGESESGVQITMPSTMTTAHGYMIDMRYGSAADFYMENITFNITLTSSNAVFYRDSGGSNFIVKNCSFNYTTNVATPSSTQHVLFYTSVIDDDYANPEQGRFYSGLYGCYFNTETTKIINICRLIMVAKECKFYSLAGRIQLVTGNSNTKLYNCFIDAYELGGTYEIEIYDSYVKVSGNVYDDNGYELEIARLANSILVLGTLQNSPAISLGECTDSDLQLGGYDVSGGVNFGNVQGVRSNCNISCGQFALGYATIGCRISCTSLKFTSGARIMGNLFRNTLTSVTVNNTNQVIDGNVFEGTGSISITGNYNIFTSNYMKSMSLADTGTGTQKANNITA